MSTLVDVAGHFFFYVLITNEGNGKKSFFFTAHILKSVLGYKFEKMNFEISNFERTNWKDKLCKVKLKKGQTQKGQTKKGQTSKRQTLKDQTLWLAIWTQSGITSLG